MRAIRASIYEDKRLGNCSNHGISERYDSVLVICEDGPEVLDEENLPENTVEVVTRYLWGEKHFYLKPVAEPGKGRTSYMAGGSYAGSSDSRFVELAGGVSILPLHDRSETWEHYDSMFN